MRTRGVQSQSGENRRADDMKRGRELKNDSAETPFFEMPGLRPISLANNMSFSASSSQPVLAADYDFAAVAEVEEAAAVGGAFVRILPTI